MVTDPKLLETAHLFDFMLAAHLAEIDEIDGIKRIRTRADADPAAIEAAFERWAPTHPFDPQTSRGLAFLTR
jgi:hypothetical protein